MIKRISVILALSCVLGLLTNLSLIDRYFSGEFEHGFLSPEEFGAISFITAEEAEDLFSTGSAIFIDTREEEAFLMGRILGAVNIPFVEVKELEESVVRSLSKERPLVIYCDGSECRSSVSLAKLFKELEFLDIRVFFGGWTEWVRRGLPVEAGNGQK